MVDLTETDYDALYVAVKEDMPRITRKLFPLILKQLIRAGELRMTVTDTEIEITNTLAPQLGIYRITRKRALH
jgi:hypothetical protein